MQFNPCMKHKLIRNSVRHFAETELAPIAAEIDRNATFPLDVIEKMKKLNYFGLQVPKEFGGAAMDSISAAIVVEEISRVCAAVGLCVTVHNGVAVYPFLQFATPEQKKHYLPKLASGEIIGAFSLTEANAGSDSASVETTAVKKNQEYILNGTKIFVTNGGVCDLALIFALPVLIRRARRAVFLLSKVIMPDFYAVSWKIFAECAPIPFLRCFWKIAVCRKKIFWENWAMG